MKKSIVRGLIGFFVVVLLSVLYVKWDMSDPVSSSGVHKAVTQVETDVNGHTVEQNQIIERYKQDNLPGAVKHLYIISAYSGQVLIYSTVKGKVTSSGKRLTPGTVNGDDKDGPISTSYNYVKIGPDQFTTDEVIQDDGTYGSSAEYIYWFDVKGVYHQQYITGGMILHISSEPIVVKEVILKVG